jgi:hypothetical protein
MTTIDEVRIRSLRVGALLDMFEHPSGDEWEFLRQVLLRILGAAGLFCDDHELDHYDYALGVAEFLLAGETPKGVIQCMAATAYFMLKEEKREGLKFSAETRARLERIRDTDPDFAERAATE